MAETPLEWDEATIWWASEIEADTAVLSVPAYVEGYAARILADSLPDALAELSQVGGRSVEVEVEAGQRTDAADDAPLVPGRILITADQLTERFDPRELRAKLDQLANEAVLEGNVLAERDYKRGQDFLAGLTGD